MRILSRKWHQVLLLLAPLLFYFESSAQVLKQEQVIDLPGPVGKRFESVKIDYKNHSAYVAHFGADQVYVVDSNTGKYLKTITDTPGVGGIEVVASRDKIYTSNFTDESIGVVDRDTMKVEKRITAEDKPNGSTYDDDEKKLYVADENAKSLIIIDVKRDRHVSKIHFESKLGIPQYDPKKKKIYVNLQDQNIIATVNPVKYSVESEFAVQKCKGNHGLALDPSLHLAFIGCQVNNVFVVYDLEKHKTVYKTDVPTGIDGIAYDPKLKRAYAACDSGMIITLQVQEDGQILRLKDFKVPDRIHSLAVNAENHKLFLPEEMGDDNKPAAKLLILDAVTDSGDEIN